MSDPRAAWESLRAHLAGVTTLNEILASLAWDQQVNLPLKAAASRARQSATLGQLAHERVTDPRVGEWLATLEGAADELDDVQRAAIRNLRRSYDRAVLIPSELVGRTSRVNSEAFGAWMRARGEKDFSLFAPSLGDVLACASERARCLDASEHPYEVLLQDFDPGTTLASLRVMFARLRDGLAELLGAIAARPALPALGGAWDPERQLGVHREVAAALGYDFDGGRLDRAEHPFTINLGPGDVRITTRTFEGDLLHGLGGTIHEAGHALYEQGIPAALYATGAGSWASLGLHESQSRFWENFIGRSRPFQVWLSRVLAQHFPGNATEPDALYRAANRVVPGLIRVAADEVTYNLHIIVRFELEVALLEGDLAPADVPGAWNERLGRYLGVTPANDLEGALQDVHWATGSVGYFPSYTLGNLYAASLAATLEASRPSLWAEVERGEFAGILDWLRANVHARGHLAEAPEIVRAAVGERDSVEDLLAHVWARHGALHGVSR